MKWKPSDTSEFIEFGKFSSGRRGMTSLISSNARIRNGDGVNYNSTRSRTPPDLNFKPKHEVNGDAPFHSDSHAVNGNRLGPAPSSGAIKVLIPSNADPQTEIILEMDVDPSTQIMDFLVRLCAQYRLQPPSDYSVWAPTGVSRALEQCKASARLSSLHLDGTEVQTPVDYLKIVRRKVSPVLQAQRSTSLSPVSSSPSPSYYQAFTANSLNPSHQNTPFEPTQRVLVTILPLSCHKKCVVRASLDEALGEILVRVCGELLLDHRSCQLLNPQGLTELDLRNTMRTVGLASEIYLLPPVTSTIQARYSGLTQPHRFPSDVVAPLPVQYENSSPVPSLKEQAPARSSEEKRNFFSLTLYGSSRSEYVIGSKTLSPPPSSGRANTLAANCDKPWIARQKPKMTDIGSLKKGLTLFHRSSMSVSQNSNSPQPPQAHTYNSEKSIEPDDVSRTASHRPHDLSHHSSGSSSHSSSPSLSSSVAEAGLGRNRRRRAPLPPPLTTTPPCGPTTDHHDEGRSDGIGQRETTGNHEIEDDVHSYSSGYHGSSMSPSPAGFEKNNKTSVANQRASNKDKFAHSDYHSPIEQSAYDRLPFTKKKGIAPKPPTGDKSPDNIKVVSVPKGNSDNLTKPLTPNIDYDLNGNDNCYSDHYDRIDRDEDDGRDNTGNGYIHNHQEERPESVVDDSSPINYENIKALNQETERSTSPENIYENVKDADANDSFDDYERRLRGSGHGDSSPAYDLAINDDAAFNFANGSFTDTSSAVYSEVKRSTLGRDANDSTYSNLPELEENICCTNDEQSREPIVEFLVEGPILTSEKIENVTTTTIDEGLTIEERFDLPRDIPCCRSNNVSGDPEVSDCTKTEPNSVNTRSPHDVVGVEKKLADQLTKPHVEGDTHIPIQTTPKSDLNEAISPGLKSSKESDKVGIKKRVSFFKLRTADVSEIVKKARNIPISEDEDSNHTNPNPKSPSNPKIFTTRKANVTTAVEGAVRVPSALRDPKNERPWTLTTLFRSNSKCQTLPIPTANEGDDPPSHTPSHDPPKPLPSMPSCDEPAKGGFDELLGSKPAPDTVDAKVEDERGEHANGNAINQSANLPKPHEAKKVDIAGHFKTTRQNLTPGQQLTHPGHFYATKSPAIRSSLYSKFNSILSTLSLSSSSSSSSSTTLASETKAASYNDGESSDSYVCGPNEIQTRDRLLLQIRTCGGKDFLKKRAGHGTTNTLYQSS